MTGNEEGEGPVTARPHPYRSGDSTARLWPVNAVGGDQTNSIVLSHKEGGASSHMTSEGNGRDVTSVHWSVRNATRVLVD